MTKENMIKGYEIQCQIERIEKELKRLDNYTITDSTTIKNTNGGTEGLILSQQCFREERLYKETKNNLEIFMTLQQKTFENEIERLEKELKTI